MSISTLSDLSSYVGHHDVFHTDDWVRNALGIVTISGEHKCHNGYVSDVIADVEVNKIKIRTKVRKTLPKIPTFEDAIIGEMDVIYFYDAQGNYSCSEVLNKFALIKEELENGTIEMPFYGVVVYEENPDWMRVTQSELYYDPLISNLTFPELMLNLPLTETLERRILGILNSKLFH